MNNNKDSDKTYIVAWCDQTHGDVLTNKEVKKVNDGGSIDMYEGHEVKGGSIQGDYGTNSSMQNYYKDLLG